MICIKISIQTNKPSVCRVVVSGLQIIPLGLDIVIVTTVAEWIDVSNMAGIGFGNVVSVSVLDREDITPCDVNIIIAYFPTVVKIWKTRGTEVPRGKII